MEEQTVRCTELPGACGGAETSAQPLQQPSALSSLQEFRELRMYVFTHQKKKKKKKKILLQSRKQINFLL